MRYKNNGKICLALILFLIVFAVDSHSYRLNVESMDEFSVGGHIFKTIFWNDFVFVGNFSNSIKVFQKGDVNFKNQVYINEISVNDFLVRNDYLFLISEFEGLFVYKIQTKGRTIELETIFQFPDVSSPLKNIFIKDNLLFITTKFCEIYIFELSQKNKLEITLLNVKYLDDATSIMDLLFLNENDVFVADASKGVLYFTLENKDLKYKKLFSFHEGATKLYENNSVVYVGNRGGIYLTEFVNKKELKILNMVPISTYVTDLVVDGDRLYYTGEQEIGILNIANQKSVYTLLSEDLGCFAMDVNLVSKNEILVSAFCAGLKRLKLKEVQ